MNLCVIWSLKKTSEKVTWTTKDKLIGTLVSGIFLSSFIMAPST